MQNVECGIWIVDCRADIWVGVEVEWNEWNDCVEWSEKEECGATYLSE